MSSPLGSERKRVGVQLTLGAKPRKFFFFSFSPPTCSFFSFFFSAKMLISASYLSFFSILRKSTLFLCSFHNNDNKFFVGYFWKLKKEKCSHTTRPWHSWNLSHYYFTVSYLSNHSTTFFSSFSQVAHWSAEIQTKVYDPRKEGRIA